MANIHFFFTNLILQYSQNHVLLITLTFLCECVNAACLSSNKVSRLQRYILQTEMLVKISVL